jgi:hypothetical protein
MSKQELIIQILATNEVNDGLIDQSLYDFMVESLKQHFNLKTKQARQSVTHILRSLYVAEV